MYKLPVVCRHMSACVCAPRLPTDIRTPRTAAAGQDSIMAQAENLARLTAAQTPLMGGENPELNPTDFAGIQPKVRQRPMRTWVGMVNGQRSRIVDACLSQRRWFVRQAPVNVVFFGGHTSKHHRKCASAARTPPTPIHPCVHTGCCSTDA